MADEPRPPVPSTIELEVEVEGTPEEVWQAIATGPGISSWYVPHTVEEHEGGAATASFGPGPEMTVPGRVAAWEPPRRIVFDGGEGAGGLAFEWLVEARDGGTCVVRLVNSGFGSGEPWDDQYDDMVGGWKLFLRNLQLHCAHFRGQAATAMLPMGAWPGSKAATWSALCRGLGLPEAAVAGDEVATSGEGVPRLAGTVVDAGPTSYGLLLTEPAPGTAFVAAESGGEGCGVSVWSYLYGPEGAAAAARDEPRWWAWLADAAPDASA